MKKNIVFVLAILLFFYTGCNFSSSNSKTNENETKLTYKDEKDNEVKSVSYKPSKGIVVEKLTIDNIEYVGYFKNGNKNQYVFSDETINDYSDVVLKAKWIQSSFSEIPYKIRKEYDESYYKDHTIYKNKYGNEFYDRDSRTSWTSSTTVVVH